MDLARVMIRLATIGRKGRRANAPQTHGSGARRDRRDCVKLCELHLHRHGDLHDHDLEMSRRRMERQSRKVITLATLARVVAAA